MTSSRNRPQLHQALDALKDKGTIHGWGRDRLTSQYVVALGPTGPQGEEDTRFFLSAADTWALIERLWPQREK